MRGKITTFLGFVSGLILWSAAALAHPHQWIDMRSQLIVSDDGMVTGLRVEWKMDKGYTLEALDGLQKTADGNYSTADLQALTEENLGALKDYGYFVYFRSNDEKQPIGKAFDGLQTYDPKDKRLTLLFSVLLEKPLDPRQGPVTLKIYDPEYFIDFGYVDSKPILISKPLSKDCSASLMPIPKDSQLEDTRMMLASKDKAWKPGEDEDYGGLFAQPVEVKCAP
jgi:ABC-type uncharacterized transport system substrate-binding protein